MSVTLSFARRRSRNFVVLVQIRRLCAYALALNLRIAIRWIPSEQHVSDEPSRLFDPDFVNKYGGDEIWDGEPRSHCVPAAGRSY